MVETGFLERFEDATFGPGSRIITGVREEFSYAPLWELSTEVNETAQLWVRSGDHRVCLMSVEAPHELRITLPVGARLPLPAGSSGAILAETAEAAASLAKFGWVESEGKRVPGVGSVSAPIIVNGRILGAVCIAMPLNRVIKSVGQDFGDATRRTAEKMAAQLA